MADEGMREAWRTVTNVALTQSTRAREPVAADRAAATNGSAEPWPELRAAVAALPLTAEQNPRQPPPRGRERLPKRLGGTVVYSFTMAAQDLLR